MTSIVLYVGDLGRVSPWGYFIRFLYGKCFVFQVFTL